MITPFVARRKRDENHDRYLNKRTLYNPYRAGIHKNIMNRKQKQCRDDDYPFCDKKKIQEY